MRWLHHHNCELPRYKRASSLNGCTVACHGPARDRNLCLEEHVLGIKGQRSNCAFPGCRSVSDTEKKTAATGSPQQPGHLRTSSAIHSPAFFSYLPLSCSPWSPSFCTSLLECTSNQCHIKIPTTQRLWTRMKIPLFIKQFDPS